MTPPKLILLLLEGPSRAHLVIRLRFYGSFKILEFLLVLIWPFSMQILKRPAKSETMTKKSIFFAKHLIFM